MHFKVLSEIGHHYLNEEGTEGVRRGALGALETRLQLAYGASDRARTYAYTRQVATGLPREGRVRALAAFHLAQQDRYGALERANAEVIRVRQWLHRQHCTVTPGGRIQWLKSARVVVYDREARARDLTRVRVQGGRLFTADNRPLDTGRMVTHFSGPGYAIYVMSWEGHLYVSSHSVGYRHHSSLLAGGLVSGAGELKVTDGRIVLLSNKSGHYRPDSFHLLQVLHALFVQGVPLNFQIAELTKTGERRHANIVGFLLANGFDDATMDTMQILHGYGHHITPQFLLDNQLAWVPSTQGALLGGIYDMSQAPWRRVPYAEFSGKMQRAGLLPKFVFASGAGR